MLKSQILNCVIPADFKALRRPYMSATQNKGWVSVDNFANCLTFASIIREHPDNDILEALVIRIENRQIYNPKDKLLARFAVSMPIYAKARACVVYLGWAFGDASIRKTTNTRAFFFNLGRWGVRQVICRFSYGLEKAKAPI